MIHNKKMSTYKNIFQLNRVITTKMYLIIPKDYLNSQLEPLIKYQ